MTKLPQPDADLTTTPGVGSQSGCAVLLGASNLTLAWPRLIPLVCQRFPSPVHVYTAHGMGRSYMLERTGFAVGRLPGILRCGIWDALPCISNMAAPYALITDLGNDLGYGCEPQVVVAAAEESVQRLRNWDPRCRIVLTRPPVQALHRLGRLRFLMFRSVLFPFSRLTLEEILQKCQELDERLTLLAEQQTVHILRPKPEWYGLDPIHVRRRCQRRAFTEMLDPCDVQPRTASHMPRASHSRPTAEVRWVLGTERRTQQPSVRSGEISVFAY
ncbi:MAG: hypothetical protein GY758_31160 [Fuerstiella sp.]|nr:hypothetical protein [Fuerstiella sp.]